MATTSPASFNIPPGQTLVITPTYNEAENIHTVIELVMSLPERPSLLIVDDGSPDGTSEEVRSAQAAFPDRLHLMERAGKQGLGTAYIAGFRFALAQGYDFICEMDADLSHNPRDLSCLIQAVKRGETDLAIGSRYIDGVRVIDWPLSRLILSYGASIYTRLITRLPVRDVTAGFKCYHRRVLEAIDLDRVRSNGYSFQIEMKYRAWRAGFRLKEVPIVFTERSEGKSKMSNAIVREAMLKVWELRFRTLFRCL